MTDLNEKHDLTAELNDEELESVAGGSSLLHFGCSKCGYTVYDEEIETDQSGKKRHKGGGGFIFDLYRQNAIGIFKPNIKITVE